MSERLEKWKNQLEEHFWKLAQDKAAHGHFVYAIEHGLTISEIDEICLALSDHLSKERQLDSKHWLIWIVAAAEIGYQYDGDEYWASFSEKFQAWPKFGDRRRIRSWFQLFAKNFHGFQPSGRWAGHFKNIAWPISHSILPKYLQTLFTTHLHDLRFELSQSELTSQHKVGELLHSRYHGSSSRFENLLEQTELTGRLVLALRDEDIHDADAPIYKPALSRIISDLEELQSVRSRFRDARSVLRKARIQATQNLVRRHDRTGKNDGKISASTSMSRVRLIARQLSDGSWKLGVAFPNLTTELSAAGISISILDQFRVRLFDNPTYWTPGRNLQNYYSGREQALSRLPDPIDSPLLVLDRPLPQLAGLIEDNLHIFGSEPWVLRIHSDGVARQVLGKHVRPGESYLIITSSLAPTDVIDSLELQTENSLTEGAITYYLNIPHELAKNQLNALKQFDLGYSLRAHVEPVGLVPRWEGTENMSTWLTTEEPLLQLSADFPVRKFLVSIDGGESVRIPVRDGPNPIIALENLEVGSHTITVLAESPALSQDAFLETETLHLRVRVPRPWKTEISRKAGIRVTLDPSNASLDRLLSGNAMLSVLGPLGRIAHMQVRLLNASGHVFESTEVGQLKIPANQQAVQRLLGKLKGEPLSEAVECAPQIELSFAVEELGISSVSFSQKVHPLRWKLENRDHNYFVRLIDEADSEESILIECYSITWPDRKFPLDLQMCLTGSPVEPPGALYVARLGEQGFSVVASIPGKDRMASFTELATPILFGRLRQEAVHIPRLLSRYSLWRKAKPLGPLGPVRKEKVLEAFEQRIFGIVCSADWVNRAYEYLHGQRHLLDQLRQEVGGSPGFGARIRSTDWNGYPIFYDAIKEFTRLAKVYNICDDLLLSEVALTLAFRPHAIQLDLPEITVSLFEQIMQNQHLVRGAYLAKFVSIVAKQDAFIVDKAV